jgi:hypothetical protein
MTCGRFGGLSLQCFVKALLQQEKGRSLRLRQSGTLSSFYRKFSPAGRKFTIKEAKYFAAAGKSNVADVKFNSGESFWLQDAAIL